MSTINLTIALPLTDTDREVLKALAETGLNEAPHYTTGALYMATEGPRPQGTGYAEDTKKAPYKAGGHTPKPESVEDVAKAKPEPAPAKPATTDEDGSGTSVDDAVAAAAALLSEGKAEQVKAALAALDINRVSQLKPSQVEAFLNELG